MNATYLPWTTTISTSGSYVQNTPTVLTPVRPDTYDELAEALANLCGALRDWSKAHEGL